MTIKNIFEGVVERHQPRIKGLWFTKPKPTHSDSAIISCIKLHEGRLYDVVKELGADQRRRVEQIAMFDTPSPRRSNLAKIHRNAQAARAPKIVVT